MKKIGPYRPPRLLMIARQPGSAACLDGSSASDSGWTCEDGGGFGGLCDPNGSSAVKQATPTCEDGGNAVGVADSCWDGTSAIDSDTGSVCAVGGDTAQLILGQLPVLTLPVAALAVLRGCTSNKDWGQPLTRDKYDDSILLKECQGEDNNGATFED